MQLNKVKQKRIETKDLKMVVNALFRCGDMAEKKAGRGRSSILGELLFYPEVETFSFFRPNDSSISSDIFTEDFDQIIWSWLFGNFHYLHLLPYRLGLSRALRLIWLNIKQGGVSSPGS